MRAVVIGAGKVGCGYLCPLFLDSGWEVVLVARTVTVAERMAAADGYRVRTTGGGAVDVRGFETVASRTCEFEKAVATADCVVTSVGVGRVPELGADLATALAGRRSPLQVLLVENHDSAPVLERAVRQAAAELGVELPRVAFAGAVADVTVARGDWNGARPEFVRDQASTLRVDASRLLKPINDVPGVVATPNYQAELQEKLFVFSAGHALCAYLGSLRGHRLISDAVHDPILRPLIAGCLLEARSALLGSNPVLGTDVRGPAADALRRYANEELADPVTRVARDPIRKLAPADRLLGPANLIRAVRGSVPAHFALGIAGALLYRDPRDEQARLLEQMLHQQGLPSVLRHVCGLARGDELAEAVERRYRGFILTEDGALFPPVREQIEAPLATSGSRS